MMKRMFSVLSVLVFVGAFFAASAFSMDGAMLYKRCQGCHGADGSKHALGTSAALKGQSAADIEQKLLGYQNGDYGGAKKMVMGGPVKKLSADEIKALADYIATF